MQAISQIFDSEALDVAFGFDIEAISKTRFYRNAFDSELRYQDKYHWIYFNAIMVHGLEYKFSLCLTDGQLDIVMFSLIGESYGYASCDWTKEKELKRKEAHEALLVRLFDLDEAEDPSHFCTKELELRSIYESKGGPSYVVMKRK